MNCEHFEQRLDDYLDGELPPGERSRLETHLQACRNCAGSLARAENLQRRSALLAQRREPAHDLWPAIAARLEPRRTAPAWHQRSGFRSLAAGIALVTVFVGGMLTDRVMRESDHQVTRVVENDAPEQKPRLPDVREARRVLPASHVELIEGNGGIGSSTGLNNRTERDLLRNLLLVNLAIKEIEAAAMEEPSNANLRELLTDLYMQENRIITQAERMRAARQSPTRTGI